MKKQCSFLLDAIKSYAQTQPNAVAIHFDNQQLSYATLWLQIEKTAHKLSGSTGIIGIHVERTPKLIILMLACWHAGCAYLALDKKHPLQRKLFMLTDASPSLVICDDETSLVDFSEFGATMMKGTIQNNHTKLNIKTPSSLAYLLYTSGSTGKPKGVMIAEHSVKQLLCWANDYYTKNQLQSVLASTTVTFDLSVFEMFLPLFAGCTVYLIDSILSLIDNSNNDLAISLINTVPSAIREVIRVKALPTSCQTINLAGEALSADLVKELYQFEQVQHIYNLWGPSEDTTYSTVYLCPHSSTLPQNIPIGKGITGSQVFLLDIIKNDQGHDVGEICISGSGLSLGYFNNSVLTDKSFQSHPDNPNLRIYRTGDLGYYDKNILLHFCGRKDLQVKIRGHRIELEEIESKLYAHPAVSECIVSVLKRDNNLQLVASIKNKDENLTESSLKNHLRKSLPEYMVPSHLFLSRKPLAKTPNGKLCRKQALVVFASKFSKHSLENPTFESIINSILGDNVCFNDSFLNQGGDSLQAVQFMYELQHQNIGCLHLNELLNINNSLKSLKNGLSPCKEISSHQSQEELTDVDRMMWKANTLYQSAYNVSVSISLQGNFDREKLKRSIEQVVNNEAVFHRNYISSNGEIKPVLRQQKITVTEIPYDDSTQMLDVLNKDLKQALFEKSFNLEQDRLIRVCLLSNGKDKAQILCCAPHITMDGFALEAFLTKISEAYQTKSISLFEETSLQFSTQIRRPNAQSNIYWQTLLSQPENLVFPSQVSKAIPLINVTQFNASQMNMLTQQAKSLNMTTSSLMLYLFQILLHKVDLGDKLFVSVPIANRYLRHEKSIVANFTKSLPIYSCFSPTLSLSEYLSNQHQQLIASLNHQDADFESLLQSISNQQQSKRIFDVIYSYMDFANNALRIEDCETNLNFYPQQKKKAPLVLSVIRNKNKGSELRFESDTRYFDEQTLKSMMACYSFLLNNFETELNKALNKVNILPQDQQGLIKQNQYYQRYTYKQTLVEALFKQFQVSQNNIAIIDGDKEISYQRLLSTALTIASGLKDNGIEKGNAIGVSLDKNWLCVATLLGVLFNGCHYVPIDKKIPEQRAYYIKNNAEIDFIITDEHSYAEGLLLNDLLKNKTLMKTPILHPQDLAYIIYTSGTTGSPKGVTITQKNVMSLFDSCKTWINYSETDIWTLFHSYAFDFSVWEIFGALLSGARLIIVPDEIVSNPPKFAKLLEINQVTMLSQTPTALKNLLHYQQRIAFKPRFLFFGGEALTMDVLKLWYEKQGKNSQLVNMYGITEITVHASHYLIDPNKPTISIGKPLADMGMCILGKHHQPLPVGFHGELCVSGEGLTQGYWRLSELNLQKFILNKENERLYLSGDLASLQPDNLFYYHGRRDKQFKLNGYRLEKEEICSAIEDIDGIQQVELKVISVDGGIQILCAYYLAKQTIKQDLIYQQLQKYLPDYAIPSSFIYVKKFPLTTNGKIDIAALPDPGTDTNKTPINHNLKITRQNTTDFIRNIWNQVLQTPINSDDMAFFELGGNSMKAVILSQQLSKQFDNCTFTIIDIFRYPTIAQQSKIIQQRILEKTYA